MLAPVLKDSEGMQLWHGWVSFSNDVLRHLCFSFRTLLPSALASLLGACFPVVARWPAVWQVYILSAQEPHGKESTPSELTHFSSKSGKSFHWPVLGHMPSFTQPLWPWWFSILIGRPESHDHSWTHWISSALLEARGFSSAQHRSHNPIPWPGWFQCLVGQAWVMWSPLAL